MEDEKPGLPTTKVLSTFSEITFLVPNSHDGWSNDVGRDESNELAIVLYRQPDQGSQIVFQDGLEYTLAWATRTFRNLGHTDLSLVHSYWCMAFPQLTFRQVCNFHPDFLPDNTPHPLVKSQ